MPDNISVTTPEPNNDTTPAAIPNELTPPAPEIQDSVSPPPSSPTGAAQPSPIPPHIGKLAALGGLAKSLLGTQNSYQVDPKTGQTVATPIKESPGSIFRHILAGAILGGAASAEHKSQGFLGGFETGGGAAIKENQQEDENRRQQAQQQFANQQSREESSLKQKQVDIEQQRANEEVKYQDGVLAQYAVTQLNHDRDFDLQTEEFLQRKADDSTNLKLKVLEDGGTLLSIPGPDGKNVNGVMDNGSHMVKYFSDPKNMTAPDGYANIPVVVPDLQGLHKDSKTGQWMDENNKPTSINDHSTWSIYQVPKASLKIPKMRTGAEINKLTKHHTDYPPNAQIPMTDGDFIALAGKAEQEDIETARIDRQDRADQIRLQNDLARMQYTDAQNELREATIAADADPSNAQAKSDVLAAKQKMKDNESAFQDTVDQMSRLYGGQPIKHPQPLDTSKTTSESTPTSLPSGYTLLPVSGLSGPDGTKVQNDLNAISTPKGRLDYIDKLTPKDVPSFKPSGAMTFDSLKTAWKQKALQVTKSAPSQEKTVNILGTDGKIRAVPQSQLNESLSQGGSIVR